MRAMVLTEHGDMDKLVYRTDYPIPRQAKVKLSSKSAHVR
jgi:hypothetical protein